MRTHLFAIAVAAALHASGAFAANRNYTVTSYDRVRVDGPYRVKLTTGVAPFARAAGSQSAIDSVSLAVQGRTLVIRRGNAGWGGYPGQSPGPVEIQVGTHELSTVWINGSGAVDIDKVRGQSLDLTVAGSGSASVGDIEVDRLAVGITGSGSARLGGKAATAAASVSGPGMLDAAALRVKDATITAQGSAVLRLNASNSAKIVTNGTASVEIGGRPACTVRASGSAVVSGCR